MQFRSSSKTILVYHPEEANLQRIKWYFSPLTEPASVFLARLLNAKLIRRYPFAKLNSLNRILTQKPGVHIILMQWVILQIDVRHWNLRFNISLTRGCCNRKIQPKPLHLSCADRTCPLTFPHSYNMSWLLKNGPTVPS